MPWAPRVAGAAAGGHEGLARRYRQNLKPTPTTTLSRLTPPMIVALPFLMA
jgi:hypothetical protein